MADFWHRYFMALVHLEQILGDSFGILEKILQIRKKCVCICRKMGYNRTEESLGTQVVPSEVTPMTESTVKIRNARIVWKKSTPLLKILIITLLVFSALALAALSWVRISIQAQTRDLQTQAAQTEGANRKLSERLEDMTSDGAIREMAKQELGLVSPDTVLIVPNETN